MTRAATTPVSRDSARSLWLTTEAEVDRHPGGPPPRPAITLPTPAALNSRFHSSSTFAASSMPPRYMIRLSRVTRNRASMLWLCDATTAQSTCATSPGPTAGHKLPCAMPAKSRPASLASSPEMSSKASTR